VFGGTGHLGGRVLRQLAAASIPTEFTFRASLDRAHALAAELGQRAHCVDLRNPAAIDELVATLAAERATPDVFIHCAGVADPRPLGNIAPRDWDELLAVNVRSAFLACRALAPRMTAGGDIVLVSALDGILPVPSSAHFAASQAALHGLVQALAKELGPSGIRINLALLGALDGGIARHLDPEMLARYRKYSALGRVAAADEAARAIVWLALENTCMTGALFPVTGGL
jgi:NAD(P)-dependent dehydrogenase (short-subunit alcohol dehydrogenase family)